MRYLLIILVFILIFGLNWLFPYIEDDYYYALKTNSNLINILQNWYSDFINLNPRIGGLWGRFVIRIGDLGFNLINTIMFFVFCFIILTYLPIKKDSTNFSILLLSLIAYIPPFIWTESFFWASGSVNYLWALTLLLFFFKPIYSYIFQNTYTKPIPSFLYLICGITAGLTNENSVPALVLISLTWLFIFNKNRKKNYWLWLGLFGLTIGSILLLTAPGQQSRLESEIFDTYRQENIITAILRTIQNFIKFLFYNLTLIITIGSLFLLKRLNSINFKLNINNPFFYWIGASFLSIVAFHFSPVNIYRNRLIFISTIFLFIGGYSIWLQIRPNLSKSISFYIKIITGLIASINVTLLFIGFINLHIENNKTIKLIQKQLPNNNIMIENQYTYDIWFKLVIPKDSLIYTDANHWKNKNISNYYSIKSLKLKK